MSAPTSPDPAVRPQPVWTSYPRRNATPIASPLPRHAVQGYLEWDAHTWAKALSFWQGNAADRIRGARVLEVGARDGGLTQWLVSRGADHVVVSDLHGPTDQARARHADYIDAGVVTHAALDVTNLPEQDAYDVIVAKSVLGGLGLDATGEVGPQRRATASILRSLRPGGVFLWAENMDSSPAHRWARSRWVAWGNRWHYLTQDDLLDVLSDFDRVDWSSAGLLAAFGRSESQRWLLGSVDSLVVEWCVPRRWNYVAFGVARKGES